MGIDLVVVGDLLLDRDVTGVADRLCPDAPVPVLTIHATTPLPRLTRDDATSTPPAPAMF